MKLGRPHALFAVMCLVWGATWIAVKAGIAVVPPSLFAGTRFVVAGSILLSTGDGWTALRQIARSDLPRFTAVTLLLNSATYALLFWGARYVSSGLAAILDLAFLPVALLTIGAILGQERFSRARVAGVALGVAGLLVLFGPDAGAAGGGGTPMELMGGGAIVLSALVYSFGAVLAAPLLHAYPPVLVSGVTTLGGGSVLVIGAVALEPGAVPALAGRWGMTAWASWLFLVLFGSLVAYTIFLHLIREWGPSRAGSYAFISPVIAVLLGVLTFGETLTPLGAFGMAMMLAAAWLTLRPALPDPSAR